MNIESNPDTRMSLILRLVDRDNHDAWSEFVQVYQPVVQRFIQRHGLQYADAAEITQEVLSRVCKSIETWDPEHERSTFRGWLYRITRNQTIDFLRSKKPEVVLSEVYADESINIPIKDVDPSVEFRAEYERQLFFWAAETIRPTFKPTNWEAFWRSTVDGEAIEQVAEDLKISCGTVYVARSRIMAKLSAMIQQRLNETSP